MIITLKGANFETNRIGTIDSYSITRVIDSGSSYSGPTSVKKNESYSGTITIKENYELSGSVSVTMGGTAVTPTINGKTVTVNISKVTGNIVIKVLTTEIVPETPSTPTYTVTYQINGHGTQPAAVSGVTSIPTNIPQLTEEGWIFHGWYKDSSLTTRAVGGSVIDSDITLYAKWTEKVASEDCTHDYSGSTTCKLCGAPEQKLVTINVNEGIRSITVTKTKGWGTTGQTITSGTKVYNGDTLHVEAVPEDGYTVVGGASYNVTVLTVDCVISPSAIVVEDVTYETVTPVDTTTGLKYFLNTGCKNAGPYDNWKYYIYDVTPGRKYHITACSGQMAPMWIMFNNTEIVKNNIINYSTDTTGVKKKEEYVVAPANAVRMVVNTRTDRPEYPIVEVHPTYQE